MANIEATDQPKPQIKVFATVTSGVQVLVESADLAEGGPSNGKMATVNVKGRERWIPLPSGGLCKRIRHQTGLGTLMDRNFTGDHVRALGVSFRMLPNEVTLTD